MLTSCGMGASLFTQFRAWLRAFLLAPERPCADCEELQDDLLVVRNRVAALVAKCEVAEETTPRLFKPALTTSTIRDLLGVQK